MLDGSNYAYSRKGVPFWLLLVLQPIYGENGPKIPFFCGVNRLFTAKCAKYGNIHIIKTTALIITKFLHSDRDY